MLETREADKAAAKANLEAEIERKQLELDAMRRQLESRDQHRGGGTGEAMKRATYPLRGQGLKGLVPTRKEKSPHEQNLHPGRNKKKAVDERRFRLTGRDEPLQKNGAEFFNCEPLEYLPGS